MKELSIEEKAKAYDKALKVAKDIRNGEAAYIPDGTPVIEAIFPELKECKKSEDNKIKDAVIEFVRQNKSFNYRLGISKEEVIAWLEKQGTSYTKKDVDDAYLKGVTDTKNEIEKQYEETYQIRKDIATFIFNYRGNIKDRAKWMNYLGIKVSFVENQGNKETLCNKCKKEQPSHSCQDITALGRCAVEHEQKPVDKVEPKFHEGEWLCENEPNNYARFIQILETVNVQGEEKYRISRDIHKDEDVVEFDFVEKYYHKFDIKDAKDGDMLACNEEILLFKSYSVQGRISLYCWYNGQTNNFHSKEVVDTLMTTRNKICPATKEQRDLLFQKMREAGYEWDAEKKELKKIENENYDGEDYGIDSLWHAQRILEKTLGKVDGYQSDDGILEHKCAISAVKQLSEQNLAWSEEDEKNSLDIKCLIGSYRTGDDEYRLYSWIDSLKYKAQPKQKWSKEDESHLKYVLTACKEYIKGADGEGGFLNEVESIEWLKSLKDRVGCEANCTTTKEWSEEDRKRIQRISDFIWKNRKGDTDDIYQQEQDVKWLKSLKNRVISQLPKEWSEEDKRIIDSIISTLSLSKSNYESNAVRETNFKSIKWLKSLRPQKALEAE